MLKIVLIVSVVVLAILAGLVLRVALETPRTPRVSISFLDYTTNAAGVRTARFTVSNAEPWAVEWSVPFVLAQTPTGIIGRQFPGAAVLRAHASRMLPVPPPTNELWRVHLRVYPDLGSTRVVKRAVTYWLMNVGFHPRYQTMPYSAESGWVHDSK